MTKLYHPIKEDHFSVTIVDNSEYDADDVLILYHENAVSIFYGMATQYEAGQIEFLGTFGKDEPSPITDYINKICNGEMTSFDFLEALRNAKNNQR